MTEQQGMEHWTRLFVSYHQYEVSAAPGVPGLEIYTIGDDLLHVRGPSRFTGFCGVHTGWIEARVRVLPGPPAEVGAGWDAISETTLWCAGGRLSVVGLMGDGSDAITDVAVPRGLVRVRVHVRGRLAETVRTDDDPPERHELHVWPVSEETPWRTVLADPSGRGWEQKTAKAAEWAMQSLAPRPAILPPPRPFGRPPTRPPLPGSPGFPGIRPPLPGASGFPRVRPPLPPDPDQDDDEAGLSRVAVVRRRPAAVEVRAGVLPVGDFEVRLERVDDETLTWSWATAGEPGPLPDDQPGTVRLRSGPDGCTLRHEGVLGRHAAALGLIWDHLLDATGPSPWRRG